MSEPVNGFRVREAIKYLIGAKLAGKDYYVDVIELYGEGFSYRDISAIVGKPVGKVKGIVRKYFDKCPAPLGDKVLWVVIDAVKRSNITAVIDEKRRCKLCGKVVKDDPFRHIVNMHREFLEFLTDDVYRGTRVLFLAV